MKGAVRKHGLMPKQDFPIGSVEKIAAYLYEYKIEEHNGFNRIGDRMETKTGRNQVLYLQKQAQLRILPT